jgi:endonuclease/exonuclease/phosphatase family metal-dependent hydrolase
MKSRRRETSLRVASANILHGLDFAAGGADIAAAAAAVAALEPDIVALQEVDVGQPRSGRVDQAAAIAAAVGGENRFAATLAGEPDSAWQPVGGRVLGPDPAGGEEPLYGVALVSRWPITAARAVRLPGGGSGRRHGAHPAEPVAGVAPTRPGYDREPRAALRCELDVAGRRLPVGVTHISYLPWRGLRQLRAAAALAATAPPADGAALLLGDLNLPGWAVRAGGRGWRPAGGGPTYPAWRPRHQPDHALVRGPVAVDDARVGPRPPGDHLPLLVRLRVAADSR